MSAREVHPGALTEQRSVLTEPRPDGRVDSSAPAGSVGSAPWGYSRGGTGPGSVSTPAHLTERTDPGDVADLERPWLEPYDDDEAAARDALWHTDYGVAGDW